MKNLLVLLLAVCTLGCSAAAKAVRTNYADFNETIQYNNSQQMLLNLVRLKYRETPLFLKVGALSASYAVGFNAELSAGKVSNHSLLGAEMGGSFSVQPTITYTPFRQDQRLDEHPIVLEPPVGRPGLGQAQRLLLQHRA